VKGRAAFGRRSLTLANPVADSRSAGIVCATDDRPVLDLRIFQCQTGLLHLILKDAGIKESKR